MTDIKLSEQHQDGQFKGFKKFIGGKLFTLGKDRSIAERTAQALLVAWDGIAARQGEWTTDDITAAKSLALGLPKAHQSKTENPKKPRQEKTSILGVIELYKSHLRQQVINNELSASTYTSFVDRLDACMFAFANVHFSQFITKENPAKAAQAQAEIRAKEILNQKQWDQLTYDDLTAIKNYFTQRPLSVTGKPISVQTASNYIHMVSRLIRDVRKPPFKLPVPEFWEDALKFSRNTKRNMMSITERAEDADDRDMMTSDDLKFYWSVSSPRMRLFQGLAYWCAWTQMELATLRKSEVFIHEGETYIDKRRSKTGEWGKWWIPQPIAKLLHEEMKQTTNNKQLNPHGLAFLTSDNFPLVHRGDDKDPDATKSDVIGNYLWPKIQNQSKNSRQRNHSFKWFRKSSAQAIRQLTKNQHIAKAFLAQDNPDVADQHYLNRMVDESIAAAKELWTSMSHIYN